ncbi:LamG-like jellyroll fold domain-containing protein [Bizionia arctica]|uniref:Cadherin domain-containing protein n=1 Tax=Bizionia arctica TaxID=1495645 RepID=A0A917GHP9_9FLAO|nr:LamG-like jellyroll fold domain-containing protein [Bizionia arctica]GGG46090.1 hypothetical protein GCM10010976_17080 [Bizionia arctica]
MNKLRLVSLIFLGLIFSCTNSTEEINDFNETNDAIITISDFEITINENPNANQYLGTVYASTNQGNIVFSIAEQSPIGAFEINSNSGDISVLDDTLFNFDTHPIITGVIKVENADLFETANVTINLKDINEINASDFSVTLQEMPSINQSLGLIEATTGEGSLTFSIIEQSPNNILEINPSTGELKVLYVPNFVGNPIISATARVENNETFKEINITVSLNIPCNPNTVPELNAFYPMNANAMDESGFNNNGTVSGAILTTNRFSESNSAYYFDGVDDNIQIEDNDQLYLDNEFTISAWVYPEEIKSQQILRKGSHVNGTSSAPFGLSLSNTNDVIFSITAGGTLVQARKQGYNINEWFLVTGVLIDQTMYLYVNDELVAMETIEGDIYNDELPLVIGTRLSLPSSTFKGKIDDVRIFNAALCPEDITELFNN